MDSSEEDDEDKEFTVESDDDDEDEEAFAEDPCAVSDYSDSEASEEESSGDYYCKRCGRDSHVASDCYARYTEDGEEIYDD